MYWSKHPAKIPSPIQRGSFILVLITGLLSSCKPEIKETGAELKFFDIKGYFKGDADRLHAISPSVTKSVMHDGTTQTKLLKIADWGTELEPFANSDINKPAWKDSYIIKKGNGVLIYLAKDNGLKTRRVMIRKIGNKLASISIFNHTKNLLYENKETLVYYPDSLYMIKKWQHVRLMGNDNYQITTKFN